MAWERMKELQKKEIPTQTDIINKARIITNKRNRALFILCYLTAGRITEIIGSLKKVSITKTFVQGREVILIHISNKKHRKRFWKDIPIPIDKEHELLDMLNEYLDQLDDYDTLFEFKKNYAWRMLTKETGFNCHFIRHIRLTHLVVMYDFNEQLLVQFAGWTDSRPAKHYMELRWKDILQKL